MARPSHLLQPDVDLEELFDLSIDPLSIIDFEGEFKRVNASFLRLLGYSKPELFSRSALAILHPDDVEPARTLLAQLAQGRDVAEFEARVICADGSVRWLEWNTRSMPERGVVYSVGRDTTERRLVEDGYRSIPFPFQEIETPTLEIRDEQRQGAIQDGTPIGVEQRRRSLPEKRRRPNDSLDDRLGCRRNSTPRPDGRWGGRRRRSGTARAARSERAGISRHVGVEPRAVRAAGDNPTKVHKTVSKLSLPAAEALFESDSRMQLIVQKRN